jgi:hypothetical protein
MAKAPFIVLAFVLVLVSEVYASAATLHVQPTGSDGSNCSSGNPCRTVAYGVSKAAAGDTVIVHAGVYRERIRVTQSGSADAPITINADGDVEVDGFIVDGNWIYIVGFRIDQGCLAGALQDTSCRYKGAGGDPNGYGFWVAGSYVTIRGNYVTGTLWSGVYVRGSYNQIVNNRFIRIGACGLTIFGSHNVIEGNEVADVMPYWFGPDGQWSQDQDGIRLFGTGHVIRNNYIHDIYTRREGPHTDGMQTFDNNGPQYSLIDVLIEGNTIINTANAGMFQSHFYALSRNVTWRNNTFVNSNSHMIQAGVRDFRFEGNIFYCARYLGITSGLPGSVEGNTFLWVLGTYPPAVAITGSNNRAYPTPRELKDPVKTEPGGTVGIRPSMTNIPLLVFRTTADGNSGSLYLALGDASQLVVGSIIEIDSDGFARTVKALNPTTGRVDFSPSISGAMARVPGSFLPADFGQWLIAAAHRTVAVWATKNVTPDFSSGLGLKPPANVRIIR